MLCAWALPTAGSVPDQIWDLEGNTTLVNGSLQHSRAAQGTSQPEDPVQVWQVTPTRNLWQNFRNRNCFPEKKSKGSFPHTPQGSVQ